MSKLKIVFYLFVACALLVPQIVASVAHASPQIPTEAPLPISIQAVGSPHKIGATPQQQEYIDYAWTITGNDDPYDKWFIWTLEAENGDWNPLRQSTVAGEDSWGFCQIHRPSHPDIYQNPKMFSDWKWQMDTCYQMWERAEGKRSDVFHALRSNGLMDRAQKNIVF